MTTMLSQRSETTASCREEVLILGFIKSPFGEDVLVEKERCCYGDIDETARSMRNKVDYYKMVPVDVLFWPKEKRQ